MPRQPGGLQAARDDVGQLAQQRIQQDADQHDVAEAVALADRVLLIDRGGIALDASVTLPRSRSRAAPGFAELEDRVLRHIIGHPVTA